MIRSGNDPPIVDNICFAPKAGETWDHGAVGRWQISLGA